MQNVLYMAMTEFQKVASFILKSLFELKYLCFDLSRSFIGSENILIYLKQSRIVELYI